MSWKISHQRRVCLKCIQKSQSEKQGTRFPPLLQPESARKEYSLSPGKFDSDSHRDICITTLISEPSPWKPGELPHPYSDFNCSKGHFSTFPLPFFLLPFFWVSGLSEYHKCSVPYRFPSTSWRHEGRPQEDTVRCLLSATGDRDSCWLWRHWKEWVCACRRGI